MLSDTSAQLLLHILDINGKADLPKDTLAPANWSILQIHARAVTPETHADGKWHRAKRQSWRTDGDTCVAQNKAEAIDGNTNVAIAKPRLAVKGNSLALVVDGHIEGVVAHHKKHLTVGKRGRVIGQVHASSVTVLGQVIGEIRSEGTVSLSRGAEVEGYIFCARVLIENGAKFIGQVNGEIRSDGFVSLAKGADVEGNIFCARVVIEDGARFKGRIDTGEPPNIKESIDPARGKSVRSGKTRTAAA